eukprot:gene18373-5870_t
MDAAVTQTKTAEAYVKRIDVALESMNEVAEILSLSSVLPHDARLERSSFRSCIADKGTGPNSRSTEEVQPWNTVFESVHRVHRALVHVMERWAENSTAASVCLVANACSCPGPLNASICMELDIDRTVNLLWERCSRGRFGTAFGGAFLLSCAPVGQKSILEIAIDYGKKFETQ